MDTQFIRTERVVRVQNSDNGLFLESQMGNVELQNVENIECFRSQLKTGDFIKLERRAPETFKILGIIQAGSVLHEVYELAAKQNLEFGFSEAIEAEVAQLTDVEMDFSDCEDFSKDANALRTAFNKYFWDQEQCAYVDGINGMTRVKPGGWLPADDGVKICSSIANTMALAFGLPEAEHQPEQLLKRIVDGKLPLKPTTYYMEYLFMAADRYQLPKEDKLKLFALWKPFMKEGIREAWSAGDYSHAWSASPAYWMRKEGFF
jgi:hypothetical protein